jgi:glycosyltransferase involved in cell wall biosynthesis
MRIVHVVSSLDLGGAERLLVDLASEQSRQGHVVRVVSLTEGGALAPTARDAGVLVEEFETRRGRLSYRLRGLANVVRSIRSDRREVIHTWMYHSGLIAAAVAPRRRRVVVTIHHDDPRDSGMGSSTRATAKALGILARAVGSLVYVSESARTNHELAGYPAQRATVIPGGVDVRRFHPIEAVDRDAVRAMMDPNADVASKIVICLARYHPDKDPAVLISAFAKARGHDCQLRLWMIGRGMDTANHELIDLIQANGVEEAVVLLGPVPHPEQVIRAGDVIAVSSRTESFGLALIEGMLSGLTGVSTDVGVASTLLPPDRLVAVGDVEAYAEALSSAASGRSQDSNREAALAYGSERMSQRFMALYSTLQPS